MAESGGNSSAQSTKGADRISELPDSIIHHILSFLPSTEEMIRTGILSKRWLHQWTRVPVFIFNFFNVPSSEGVDRDFANFIDSSLMFCDCSKVKKLQLELEGSSGQYNREIRLAVAKNVEELILDFGCPGARYKLPNFLFNCSSLVKLQASDCIFVSDLNVNFKSLKDLRIFSSELSDGVIENIISGSPKLETFELSDHCQGFKQLVIVSETLKSLSLGQHHITSIDLIEIECPKLEKLVLHSIDVETLRLKLPSLMCATLYHHEYPFRFYEDSTKQLLEQFPHVEELELFGVFVKRVLQLGGLSPPLSCRSLILVCSQFGTELPEIKYALCSSPLLEKLVIKLGVEFPYTADLPRLIDFEEAYQKSNGIGYTCLASHLKTVKIIDLTKEKHRSEDVLQLVGFLLKNARVLEKMVVILADGGTEFLAEVSQKLLKLPRCSPHCKVEVQLSRSNIDHYQVGFSSKHCLFWSSQ